MRDQSDTWLLDERPVVVSHLEDIYWPDDSVNKGEMLRYYQQVAPIMLPHLRDRPVTLRIFPDGPNGSSYYRRDMPEDAPTWLRSVDYQPQTVARTTRLPLVDDAAGLVWLANQGCVEFHAWGARQPRLTQPDQAIFDLDSGDMASFADTLRAALRLREALEHMSVRSYAKTSGGRGLHVYAPLASGHTFADVRAWVKTVAQRLADASPDLIAVAHGATHRGAQVTIDFAQNSMGRNTAAPYTVRAHPHAPVSAPLTWDEIEAGQARPSDLTLRTMPERLRRLGDLFAPTLRADQRLPALD